ncbi:hypothetical protein [Deinococcus xianganensis]|uniref:Uncharacterized protein n=1 Tax=Deinococcus xianganensis TaxID=1507289 RepID=A0A6I4YJ37_9DEIO|nr:hypothetical protein [Deinococcus xianganensis]MXV19981.1 hypothetical protein [Deinococcus xianganensis]
MRPKISRLKTWEKFQSSVLDVVEEALSEIAKSPPITKTANEDELNMILHRALLDAYRKFSTLNKYTFETGHFKEANNQPDQGDEYRDKRLHKRPDFQWSMLDHHAADPKFFERRVILECKRIGKTKKGRIFSKLYVENGILRFITKEHGYAQNEALALMVGYLQSSNGNKMITEVNGFLRTDHGLTEIALDNPAWNVRGVTRMSHQLTRSFGTSPIVLRHLWVDIR